MRWFALFLLVLTLAPAARAQDDDRGFIQGLLEKALSGEGRSVTIHGFAGALSSEATIEQIEVADADGVWLSLDKVVMSWNRLGLLRGRIDIEKLSAARISLPRLPLPEGPSAEDAVAKEFALPDLPVSVRIETLDVPEVDLGAPVAGVAARFAVDGGLTLDGGEGNADLKIRRTDAEGRFDITAGFSNETRRLAANIALHEGHDGFLVTILKLPGAPRVDLTFAGDAPLSDFTGELALSTDGVRRVTGALRIAAAPPQDGVAQPARVGVDLRGDVTPLLPEAYHPFFGTQSHVVADVISRDGAVEVERLSVDAAELRLNGTLSVRPDGLPSKFDLSGELGHGEPVQLPVSGDPLLLRHAVLSARYDEATGREWTLSLTADDAERGGIRMAQVQVQGGGTITPDAPRAVTAKLTYALNGVDAADPAMGTALGTDLAGQADIGWTDGGKVRIREVTLDGAGLALALHGTLGAVTDGLPFDGDVRLQAQDISRFAGIAQRPLAGAVDVTADGVVQVLSGIFDVAVRAETTDLQLGDAHADRFFRGKGTLGLNAARDTTGTRIAPLRIRTDAASAELTGQMNAGQAQIALVADLPDMARVEPRLSGPGTVRARADWTRGADIHLRDVRIALDRAELTGQGRFWPERDTRPFEGDVHLVARDLDAFSGLAGRGLGGAVDVTLRGSGALADQSFDIVLAAGTRDLAVSQPNIDRLFKGRGTLDLTAQRDAAGLRVAPLRFRTDVATAELTGELTADKGQAVLRAELTDLSGIEPRVSGPGSVTARADWTKGADVHLRDVRVVLGQTELTGEGRYWPDAEDRPVEANVQLTSPDLSRLSQLAGRPLGGRIDLGMNGRLSLVSHDFRLRGSLSGASLRTGIVDLDKLLQGAFWIRAGMSGSPDQVDVEMLEIDTPQLDVNASGSLGGAEPLSLNARLSDLGLFIADFSGPVTAEGTVRTANPGTERMDLNLSLRGPGGVTVDVTGPVSQGGRQLDLQLRGQGPLALANQYITPRSLAGTVNFDLGLNGPPALSSLRGTIRTGDARVSLPSLGMAVDGIAANVALNGAQAQVTAEGSLLRGGKLSVSGPIGLTAPNPADLRIRLDGVRLEDPELYETKVNGEIRVSGPLATGGLISGVLDLPITELRVPSSGISSLGVIPDINHVNESAASRASRQRAGLLRQDSDQAGDRGPVYDLDLTIRAPNEIFVRGRGIDAELGGQVVLRGTTRDVIPSGQFELIRGRLDILSKRLVLDEGRIFLQGDFNPYLRFVATRDADDARLMIVIEGLVSSPEVRFTAQPDMPEEEVVARLIFGRGLDKLSAFQAVRLAAAVAELAGKSSGGVMGGLRAATGLADLDVNTNEEGETQVSAGFYLSDRLYSSVAVDDRGEAEVNINLDLTKSIKVKGTVESRGNTGLGVFYEKDY